MGFFEKGAVRIHYEEAGSGFPLLLIAGGGLNSNISGITGDYPPFNAIKEFGGARAARGAPDPLFPARAPAGQGVA
jgi:hypothetical protein